MKSPGLRCPSETARKTGESASHGDAASTRCSSASGCVRGYRTFNAPAQDVRGVPQAPIQASSGSVSEPPVAKEPQTSEFPQYVREPVKMEESKSGEVVWEGGAPPSLEGVESFLEPSNHGTEAAVGETPSVTLPSIEPNVQDNQGEAAAAPKRKRGRPKGSKKVKTATTEVS